MHIFSLADAAKLMSLVYEKGQLQHEMQVQVNDIHAQVGFLVFLMKWKIKKLA